MPGRLSPVPHVRARGHPPADWLLRFLALATWIASAEPVPLSPPGAVPGRTAGFTRIDPGSVGIDFVNHLPEERAARFQNLLNGCGVAAGDVNGDGLPDLYFCHRAGTNALYLNLGGGRFTNITDRAGVGCAHQSSSGALFADLNGDGHLDLFVTAFGGPNACFHGDGRGGFTDVTSEAGLAETLGATSAAAGDLDGDGDLDLYVCHFGTTSPLRDGARLSERIVNGVPTVTGRWARKVRIIDGRYVEFGEPDTLYLNDGTGRFTAAPWAGRFTDGEGQPMEPPWDFGLAVQIRDIDGDGRPDIYVCNDFQTPDRMWLGDGRGRFRPPPRHALRNMSHASMGVDFADIDRDGHLDFITVEMLSADHGHHLRTSSPMSPIARVAGLGAEQEDLPRNALYRARGDGTWEEIACMAGVAATDWSWTALFLDADLDGWPDLFVSNGHRHDVNDRDVNDRIRARGGAGMRRAGAPLGEYPPLRPRKRAFRNRGDLTFEDVGTAWGFDAESIAHGMVPVDIDGDGDEDLVLNVLDGPPLIHRNDATAPRLVVRLRGPAPNTAAVGARLELVSGAARQTREILAGGRYLSGGDTAQTFAAPEGPLTLEVRWPDGSRSRHDNLSAGHRHTLQPPARPESVPARPDVEPSPWFEDRTAGLGQVHGEDSDGGFDLDPLALRHYGRMGPGVLVADFNGDGHDDLILGGAAGHGIDWRAGDGHGGFQPATGGDGFLLPEDTTGMAWIVGSEERPFLLAQVRSADADPRLYRLRPDGTGVPVGFQSKDDWSPTPLGPLVAADADGDGRLEFFAGGWLPGGADPAAAPSRIWRLTPGGMVAAGTCTTSGGPFTRYLSAVWADLDADGHPELVTAGEWGDIVIDTPGRPGGAVRRLGVRGWWQGLVAVDVDHDGRLDLVAGNWGLNSLRQVWGDGRPGAFHGDLEGTGQRVTVEAWRPGPDAPWRPWRDRETLQSGWPSIAGRFASHADYAAADLRTVLGDAIGRAVLTEVDTLASTVFLNRGDRFEAIPLPREAQVAPVFGICAADFDGDGHTDLFLAQNCFAVRPDDSRLDAGLGLLLRGNGDGRFTAVPASESGIRIPGDQRGAAVGDFDRDGRPDLAVGQNGGETRLLLSRAGPPGVRIRITGPPGNPSAWGATVRVRSGDRTVLTRPITSGSGWWSGDGPGGLVVPRIPGGRVEVTWPGGTRTGGALPADADTVDVRHPGAGQPGPR